MKTISRILVASYVGVALYYGHGASMTEHGPFIQGYIGTVLPAFIAAFCYKLGRIEID